MHKSNPPDENADDFFDMTLTRCPDGMYRIIAINNYKKPHYIKKGIADAIIPEASRLLRAAVRSSLKVNPQDPSEFRSDEADGMWKRLMESGIALFVRAGAATYVMKANVKRSATKSPDSPSLRLSPRP